MIWKLLQWMLILVVVLLALLSVRYLSSCGKGLRFQYLRNGVKKTWTGVIWIVLQAIIFCGLFCFANMMYNKSCPGLSIKFTYSGAGKGRNPDGTRFNSSSIISNEILDEVVSRGGWNIGTEVLAECFTLETVYDEQEIKTSDLDSLSFATEYKVYYSPSVFTMTIDGKALMNLLADVYYEQFISLYGTNTAVLDFDFSELDSMDYNEVPDYLTSKAQTISGYIEPYAAANRTVSGAKTNNFSSLLARVSTFLSMDLNRYSSFVYQKGISRNKDLFVTMKNHTNRSLQVSYDKSVAYHDVRMEAVDMYNSQMVSIVRIPTVDEDMEFYMSQTKTGVDNFIMEAMESLDEIKRLGETIQANDYLIEQVTSVRNSGKDSQTADAMIESMENQLLSLADEAKTIVRDYENRSQNGMIQINLRQLSVMNKFGIKKAGVVTIGFVLVLCVYQTAHNIYVDICRRRKSA